MNYKHVFKKTNKKHFIFQNKKPGTISIAQSRFDFGHQIQYTGDPNPLCHASHTYHMMANITKTETETNTVPTVPSGLPDVTLTLNSTLRPTKMSNYCSSSKLTQNIFKLHNSIVHKQKHKFYILN